MGMNLTSIDALTDEDAASLTAGSSLWSGPSLESAGVLSVRMVDGPMGVTHGRLDERDVSLLTPCGVALAATWDRRLVSKVGQLIGQDAKRLGVGAVLGPNLNLPRSPLGGRAFEQLSEDPFLTAILGCAWVQGVQRVGVAAAPKHLLCNDSETERHSMNAVVDEKTLREVYFLPFEHAARGGAWAMMTAYNRLNGHWCAEMPSLLSQWLKEELQWDGVIMSDWFGTHDGVASLEAGLDLEMPGPARHMGSQLHTAVKRGEIARSQLNDAAARVARFSSRTCGDATSTAQEAGVSDDEARAILRQAAIDSFVLLKNEHGTLPIGQGMQRVAVVGPNAATPCYQGGTFARISISGDTPTPVTALEHAMRARGKVSHSVGVMPEFRIPPLTSLPIVSEHGEGTVNVQYFDGRSSTATASEGRHSNSLIWFGSMPGIGSLEGKNGRVRVSSILRPTQTGEYRFFVGGTGDVELTIAGHVYGKFSGLEMSGDVMGKLLRGAHERVNVSLEAGEDYELSIEMQFGEGRAQGLWFGAEAPPSETLLEDAVALAAESDCAIVFVGETPDTAVESVDRTTSSLPEEQVNLIKRVCAVNSRTIVVLNAAHAVDTSWAGSAAAILVTWFAGQEYAVALADVLTGVAEPGGRLPVTFAKQDHDYAVTSLAPDQNGNLVYDERDLVGYRHFVAAGISPAFPFGYGLGYANIEVEGAAVEQSQEINVEACATLRNVSARAGKSVVQVYVTFPPSLESDREYPRLAAFETIVIPAHERRNVRCQIPARAFAEWSTEKQSWHIRGGKYRVTVGGSLNSIWTSRDVHLRPAVLDGDELPLVG
ncbi:beta-glucosidase [Paraburkholderia metrosideri]|uniref:PA14 domain-containing protein n=1 Tax=Paraburkholderia metrosideri TaxID=580937 RepID=A0ABM8NTW4_9BURK|nr:glycoside hydrolase family 3 C-terminal domain-containing protein [Paraburkholderia metrosideri]CAD6543235.1 hypothetical protein LMG28140_03891 [Paraburkholderia metrosideri]